MEDYEEYMRIYGEESPISKLWKNIKEKHIIMFFILAGVGILLYNQNPENLKTLGLIGGGLFFLYILSIMKGSDTDKVIPRKVAQQFAYNDLIKEIGKGGSYPEGTKITPTPFCFLRHIDTGEGMKPFKWDLGFKIKEPNEPERDIVVKVHPYTGKTTGIEEEPLGYDGKSSKDIQIITPEHYLIKETPKKET